MRRDRATDAPQHPAPAPLRARLLGAVHIAVGDRTILDSDWPRRSARSLLLLLLATPGHRLSRERIIDLLWPDASPEAGQNALRVALHAVRRVLEPDLRAGRESEYVHSDGNFIALRSLTGLWVDVDQFEAALASLSSMPVSERPPLLREALSHFGGDLLADDPAAEWSMHRRERLRRLWRDAVLHLAESDAARCSLESVPALQQLLSSDASDEAAHRALMRTFMAAGHRDEALRQYARCIEALRLDLDVEPTGETVALAADIRSASSVHGPASEPARQGRIDILPVVPNPLIGRDRELETLEDLLLNPDVRLVTVTGHGGIGKTRLALEAARHVAGEFTGGVGFVDLSAITEPNLVLPTILRALSLDEAPGRPTIEVLVRLARELDLLLILDNLEQVLDAADDIGALLASCPHISVLATSREPLRLRAEHIIATPPLAVPPQSTDYRSAPSAMSLIGRYESVALFAERARAARPSFELTEANVGVVAAICSQLDGLPLAIELAAARIRHLDPEDLLAQLEQRLPILTGGARDLPARHRALRDTIGWSYDLLERPQQVLFRQIAVFSGGFSLEAAQAVCGTPGDDLLPVAERVWVLADKSLLQRQEEHDGGGIRYRMLEIIREFCLRDLESSDERDLIRRQHAAYFLALAETAEPYLHGPDQISWLDRLEQDHDNLRSALEWAHESREADTALRISGALSEYWRMKGHFSEGCVWLERALAMAGHEPSAPRAWCLRGAGVLAHAQGHSDEAVTWLTQSLDDWRALGDDRRTAQSLGLLADVARARGDYPTAIDLNERALSLFEGIGFAPGVADTLNQLGLIATDRGEHARAQAFYKRSGALYDCLGDRHGAARVLNNLGILSFWQEDYQGAVSSFERSLVLWRALGNRPHTALVLTNLGEALRAEGDLEEARAITQEGLQVSRDVGDRRSEAIALFVLGSLMQHHDYDDRATEPLVDGLRLFWQVGDRLGIAWCLEALAGAATARGRPEVAAQFLGAAEALREQVGVSLQPAEHAAYRRHLNATRDAFQDPAAFDQQWETGRALSPGEAVELAAEMGLEW